MKNRNLIFFYLITFLFFSCAKSTEVLNPAPAPPTSLPTKDQILQEELAKIDADIREGNYAETHSLLVFRAGEMLTEQYYDPFPADEVHYQYSVTKSVTSALIGIAIDQGLIQSVDQKLLGFFPEYPDIKALDRRKEAITLGDLLAMRAGFEWDEWTYSYTDSRNDVHGLITSDDMVKHMLDKPMSHTPGSHFLYNSGVTMLLSGIIQKVYGQPIEVFAANHLFKPLGIQQWQWDKGNDGLNNSGWGLYLLPRDMAKIGQLFLREGQWENQQIISKAWIEASTQIDRGNDYGYQWWLNLDRGYYAARGWGGQFIFVTPRYDLVVVMTAGNFSGSSAGDQIFARILRLLDEG